MSQAHTPQRANPFAVLAVIAVTALTGTTLASHAVLASLNSVSFVDMAADTSSASLQLTQSPSKVPGLTAGFTAHIKNLAPGDAANRFIDLGNTGILPGDHLALSVKDSDASTLSHDSELGLRVEVIQCLTPFLENATCPAGQSTSLGLTPVADLISGILPLNLATLPAGGIAHLRFQLTLPKSNETTVNGILPAKTIQDQTARLTWTFTEQAATTATPEPTFIK